jgi:hypothetical protein
MRNVIFRPILELAQTDKDNGQLCTVVEIIHLLVVEISAAIAE